VCKNRTEACISTPSDQTCTPTDEGEGDFSQAAMTLQALRWKVGIEHILCTSFLTRSGHVLCPDKNTRPQHAHSSRDCPALGCSGRVVPDRDLAPCLLTVPFGSCMQSQAAQCSQGGSMTSCSSSARLSYGTCITSPPNMQPDDHSWPLFHTSTQPFHTTLLIAYLRASQTRYRRYVDGWRHGWIHSIPSL
jgi:hypothetical protein